jgi:hypothetical protein
MPNAQYFSTRGCALSVAMPQALRLTSAPAPSSEVEMLGTSRSVQVPNPQCPMSNAPHLLGTSTQNLRYHFSNGYLPLTNFLLPFNWG